MEYDNCIRSEVGKLQIGSYISLVYIYEQSEFNQWTHVEEINGQQTANLKGGEESSQKATVIRDQTRESHNPVLRFVFDVD